MTFSDYACFYEQLGPATPIETYRRFFAENAYFEDPFHVLTGVEGIYGLFQNMYASLADPLFRVDEIVESGDVAYIRWTFDYRHSAHGKPQQITGASRVEINGGKVISHIDFWDAGRQVYEQLPVLGALVRFIRRKIAA